VFRALLYLVVSILIISVLRSIIGVITKGFAELFSPSAPAETAAPGARKPAVESLKKDPVCGTFIAPSSAVQKSVGGSIYYFCSTGCRDKFQPQSAGRAQSS
jgi:YHS domain-containing protein